MTNSTNRRGVLKGIAGVLGLATATTTTVAIRSTSAGEAAPPVPLSKAEAHKLKRDKYNKPSFNAAAYIDYMQSNSDKSLHPFIYVKHGRETAYSGWLPESIDGGSGHNYCNFNAFKSELRKRNLFKIWTEDTGAVTQFSAYQQIRPNSRV